MQKMSDFVPCGRNLFLAVNMIAAMATLSKYEYNCGLAGKMIQFAWVPVCLERVLISYEHCSGIDDQ